MATKSKGVNKVIIIGELVDEPVWHEGEVYILLRTGFKFTTKEGKEVDTESLHNVKLNKQKYESRATIFRPGCLVSVEGPIRYPKGRLAYIDSFTFDVIFESSNNFNSNEKGDYKKTKMGFY